MEKIKAELSKVDWDFLWGYLSEALTAIGVLIIGFTIAKWVDRTIRSTDEKAELQVDDTVRPLLATITRYVIVFITIYAALTILHVPTASLLAAFGAVGLAIALAVQGTLSNVAAGIMLIFLRSVRVREYIMTPTIEGTVLEVGMFVSRIKDPEGVLVVVPNAEIWSTQIRNFSRFKTRRIDININVSLENDLSKVQKLMYTTLVNNNLIVNADTAEVVIFEFSGPAAIMQARCWLKSANFRADSSALRMDLHAALREANVMLPEHALISASP